MANIETKLSCNDEVFFINPQGKITSDKVESIHVTIGSSSYRTDHWVGTGRTGVQTQILYKLFNHPAGFLLSESSVYKSKEELLEKI